MRGLRRFIATVVLLGALPLLAAPGNCGFALDFTETFLVTDPVERIVLVVDDGNLDATAYERDAILLKRHTFGFQKNLRTPQYAVEDGELRFEAHCTQEAVCGFDHLFELPLGVGFDITMDDASIDLGYIDSDIVASFATGDFRGVRLRAPAVTIAADIAEVDLDFATPPERVAVDLAEGAVWLTLPAGSYRCALEAGGEVALTGITCADDATAALELHVGAGDITITEAAP